MYNIISDKINFNAFELVLNTLDNNLKSQEIIYAFVYFQ